MLAIGNFDGVHIGHQALISAAAETAMPNDDDVAVLVLDPHPLEVLDPARAPLILTPLDLRGLLLQDVGGTILLRLPFDRSVAGWQAGAFVNVLLEHLDLRHVVVGDNFRFGQGASGDALTLRSLLSEVAVPMTIVPLVLMRGEPVSASRVRRAVADGRLKDARELLGRPFTVRGEVVHGDHLGRELGFPTANVRLAERLCLPPFGVYGGHVALPDGSTCTAAISFGTRPAVKGRDVRLEAHLLGFQGDLYGATLEVRFERFLRGEENFPSLDALKRQIATDVAALKP